MENQNRKYRIGGYQAGQRPDTAKVHSTDRFDQSQLPPKVDLRQYMTAVEEQVGNSCVANAFVGAYEYLAKRSLGDAADVSRLFVYYNARAQSGSQNEDQGTQMSHAIASLVEYGACAEAIWPNDENLIFMEPHEDAYNQAANFKITEAEAVETDLHQWKHTLAEGYPIAFALNTFTSFDEATRNRGRVPLPKKTDNVRETHGWHAMLCVGYSDKDRMFIVRNSWGEAWGDRGYCYIPYNYVIHPEYNGHDSWMVKSVSELDFSAEVWQEDESCFADEGSLLIYDFYVRTEDPEGFVDALDQLCQDYAEEEDGYYFDYEETEDDEAYTVTISNFDLTIEDGGEFLEALEALCQEYAMEEDFAFSLGAESDDSEDSEDAEEDIEEEDDEAYEDEDEAYDEEESDEEYEEEYDEECDEESDEETLEEDEGEDEEYDEEYDDEYEDEEESDEEE